MKCTAHRIIHNIQPLLSVLWFPTVIKCTEHRIIHNIQPLLSVLWFPTVIKCTVHRITVPSEFWTGLYSNKLYVNPVSRFPTFIKCILHRLKVWNYETDCIMTSLQGINDVFMISYIY